MSSLPQQIAASSAASARTPTIQVHSFAPRKHLVLRLSCAGVALLLGGIQAWVTRFAMAPDGISYLDMGDAYWRGDWHNAINAYWSPLYAWVVGFFVNVLKPGPYYEYPLVHLVNFLIYIGALLCFDFFLKNFISAGQAITKARQTHFGSGLSESSWWLLGYAVFTATSLLLVGLYRVCPDLCVAALIYLASGLIVRIRAGNDDSKTYLLLGLVLGLSYLAKAVMFPLSLVFLAVAVAPNVSMQKRVKGWAIALVAFLVVAAPLVVAISKQKGKISFGESGSWNYALYVDGMRYWETPETTPSLKTPMRTILHNPPVFEFGEPIGGTYPPWYDPTYWHDGFETHIAIHAALYNMWGIAKVYAGAFFLFLFSLTSGAFLLVSFSNGGPLRAIRRSVRWWPIALPALAALAIYSPVHAEGRFIAANAAILLLVAYAGVQARSAAGVHRMRLAVWVISALAFAMVVVAPMVRWPVSNKTYAYPNPVPGPAYAAAANALVESGVHPQDRIALIWDEQWGRGAARGAILARLARVKIVAEEPDPEAFWKSDEISRQRAIAALQSVGIRAILAKDVPVSVQQGWRRLADTDYFVYSGASHP